MCGFVAQVGGDAVAASEFAERGNRMLAHRGPDDEGVFLAPGVALGHRRLSILDLSAAGHQPMVSPCGRWAIVYNGEVYNHLDVRARLCAGWEFAGHSDTETVLAALALHGPGALERMVGMWSLALWDSTEKRLLVSRDRYGQKPLFWRRSADGGMRFSSEIKPLIEAGERPVMFMPAVGEYLATGNYGHMGERTFFRDVYSFPAAHWAYVTESDVRPEPRRYWRFPAESRERRPYDDTARRGFREAFEAAVESQLLSDVPVGATLSGGLDSSAVVSVIAASGRRGPIPVFSAQTAGTRFDESVYVRAIERRWKGVFDVEWVPLDDLERHAAFERASRSRPRAGGAVR